MHSLSAHQQKRRCREIHDSIDATNRVRFEISTHSLCRGMSEFQTHSVFDVFSHHFSFASSLIRNHDAPIGHQPAIQPQHSATFRKCVVARSSRKCISRLIVIQHPVIQSEEDGDCPSSSLRKDKSKSSRP